jgi:HK97 family phage major capsid protein
MRDRLDLLLQERTREVASYRSGVDAAEKRGEVTAADKADFARREATIKGLDERIEIVRGGREPFDARRLFATGPTADEGVSLGPDERLADYVAEHRGGFPGFNDGVDSLSGDFNLANVVRSMVTGERNFLSDTETRALSEGVDANGGFLVPAPLASQVIDLARAKTQVINAGARTVPMSSETLTMPRLGAGATGEWKLENDPVSESTQTYERVFFKAKTCITMLKLSAELYEDATSDAHTIFQNDLVQAIAHKLDYAALRGAGVDPEPLGILTTPNVNIVDLGVNGATPANYNFLIDAIAAIRDQNGEPNGVIYSSRTQTTLDKLVDTLGQPLRAPESVVNLAKFVSNQVPNNVTHGTATTTSEAYVADWSAVMIGVRPSLQIRVIPLTERYMDNFQVGLMAVLRADVQLAHPKHAAVVTGIKP